MPSLASVVASVLAPPSRLVARPPSVLCVARPAQPARRISEATTVACSTRCMTLDVAGHVGRQLRFEAFGRVRAARPHAK
jgi:hypothetical protein